MCGILGLGLGSDHKFKSKTDISDAFTTMFELSEVRGRTASGVALVSAKETRVLKYKIQSTRMTKTEAYKQLMDSIILSGPGRTKAIIGHCRFKTKGSEDDNNNNHPIVSGGVVGIHNGCIHNDEETWKSYGAQLKRVGTVDSEVIFALIDFYLSIGKTNEDAVRKVLSSLKGGMACAYIHKRRPYLLNLFKNVSNPLHTVEIPNASLIAFASQREFLSTALGENFGSTVYKVQTPDSYVGINLDTNKVMARKV